MAYVITFLILYFVVVWAWSAWILFRWGLVLRAWKRALERKDWPACDKYRTASDRWHYKLDDFHRRFAPFFLWR